jgi:hypothetical protein
MATARPKSIENLPISVRGQTAAALKKHTALNGMENGHWTVWRKKGIKGKMMGNWTNEGCHNQFELCALALAQMAQFSFVRMAKLCMAQFGFTWIYLLYFRRQNWIDDDNDDFIMGKLHVSD